MLPRKATFVSSTRTNPLQGQVAIVTGAGAGIGRAIALKLAELGAHVILCGRARAALDQTAAAIQKSRSPNFSEQAVRERGSLESSEGCSIIECDVTDLRSVESLARQVESTFQRLDILVNNAGIAGPNGPLQQLAPENWDQIMNTTFAASITASAASCPS